MATKKRRMGTANGGRSPRKSRVGQRIDPNAPADPTVVVRVDCPCCGNTVDLHRALEAKIHPPTIRRIALRWPRNPDTGDRGFYWQDVPANELVVQQQWPALSQSWVESRILDRLRKSIDVVPPEMSVSEAEGWWSFVRQLVRDVGRLSVREQQWASSALVALKAGHRPRPIPAELVRRYVVAPSDHDGLNRR